ncbi:hypothetical protein PVAND_000766 [Polypedilum vanderplanki]|uniref:EF-hand domain-containing protein n=1 Tax=Polypedilum vanderplanki TaxID=319348 RepID=A0A9J6BM17_POLVA|nr:hypothetical protein PVAND_000766 [Polypedilum vanderplanki]
MNYDEPVEIKTKLDEKIAAAFQMFDVKRNNTIHSCYVGHVLRILKLAPSEQDIQDLIKDVEIENKKGIIYLNPFMMFLKKRLFDSEILKKWRPLEQNEILELFKELDKKNKGYILKDEFINLMKTYGESMNDEEFQTMINAAIFITEDANKVNYYRYARKLFFKNDQNEEESIFNLAEMEIAEIKNKKKKN